MLIKKSNEVITSGNLVGSPWDLTIACSDEEKTNDLHHSCKYELDISISQPSRRPRKRFFDLFKWFTIIVTKVMNFIVVLASFIYKRFSNEICEGFHICFNISGLSLRSNAIKDLCLLVLHQLVVGWIGKADVPTSDIRA